jgi:hypothetical protein
MAWRCCKCDKNVFAPRKNSLTFVLEWKYVKKLNQLTADVRMTSQLKDSSVITHLTCDGENDPELFKQRMRAALKVPNDAEHPLL